MKKRTFLAGALFCLLSAYAGNDYKYFVDLTKVDNHKLQIKLIPPDITEEEAVFMFPAIVPGTYAIYNFGRFISDFKVVDKSGKEIIYTQSDKNIYKIPTPQHIDYITDRKSV